MKEPKNGEVQLFESACAGWVHVTYYRALEEVRAPSASSLSLSSAASLAFFFALL